MNIFKSNLPLIVVIAILPQFAAGQIARNVVISEREWGQAVSGSLNAAGDGTLTFERDGVNVTAQFVNSICREITYEFDHDDFATLNLMLGMNSGRHRWQVVLEEDSDTEQHPTKWIRSDERFIAAWDGGKLRISPPESEDKEPCDSAPRNEPILGSDQPPLPLPGDTIDSVIEKHGQPSGVMKSGTTQIWIYHWGTVNIRDSEVISISR